MGLADSAIYRARDEEAQAKAASVKSSYQPISGGTEPGLLNRLCQITASVLSCRRSYTALWNPKEQAYVPVASHGYTAEEWDALRLLKLPRSELADVLARLERDDVVPVAPMESGALAAFATTPRVTASLWMTLRRGRAVEGIHIATFDKPAADLPPHLERVAHELAHLASLAMENVRLLEEIKDASRLKSVFVATMGHELRTPLQAILLNSEMALSAALGPLTAAQARALRCVQKSGRQLVDLVNGTLDVSRLDTGALPVTLVQTSVRKLLAEIETETGEMRKLSGLRFIWRVPLHLQSVETDRVKLKIVLNNLIGNAIKFTPEGSVTVAAEMRAEGVEVAVTDTGIGVAPDVLSMIFEPFKQGDGSRTRGPGGVGLGLYIVRRMLDLLGGTIEIDSQVGWGSTFRVWVPRTIAPREDQTLGAPMPVRRETARETRRAY